MAREGVRGSEWERGRRVVLEETQRKVQRGRKRLAEASTAVLRDSVQLEAVPGTHKLRRTPSDGPPELPEAVATTQRPLRHSRTPLLDLPSRCLTSRLDEWGRRDVWEGLQYRTGRVGGEIGEDVGSSRGEWGGGRGGFGEAGAPQVTYCGSYVELSVSTAALLQW